MVSRSSPSDRAGRRPAPGAAHGPARGSAWASPRGDLGEDELGSGLGLIYGRNPVREALRGRRRVHAVLLATGPGGDDLEHRLAEWCAEARVEAEAHRVRETHHGAEAGGAETRTRNGGPRNGTPPIDRISPGELTARLKTPDHQDIAAVVDPYPYLDPEDILRSHTLLVALDEVQDPHNLGAIIRTAEGAGAGVLIPRHRAAEVTGAVVKASAGATEHAAVARVRNLGDFLAAAKKTGFWVYGAAAEAEQSYSSQDYRYPTCFVVGSEGEGLGRRVASLCDMMVRLPLMGTVESLNVSVSTGILLYEAVRQRGLPGGEGDGTGGRARGGA